MALFGQADGADQGDALGLLPWTNSRRTPVTPPFLDATDANAVTQSEDQSAQARTANPNESRIRLPEKAARTATPPDIQQSATPPAIAAPTNGVNFNRDVYQGRVAQPNPNDYHGPTGWKGALDKVGRVVLGEDYDRAFPSPQERYARDEKRFDTAFEHGREEQQDAAAQQERDEATARRASAAPTTRSVTVGGQEQIQDWNPATRTWSTEAGVSPAAKTPTEKAGEYKQYLVPGGKTPVMAREDEKGGLIMQDGTPLPPGAALYEKPEKQPDESGTWSLGKDENGKPIEINSKTGAVRDAPRGAQKGPGGTGQKDALAAQQKATAAIGSLNQQLAQGKIQEPAYIDQSIQEWKNVAQAARAAGQTPTGTQDLAVLYLKKYGSRDAAIKAMAADGWQVQ